MGTWANSVGFMDKLDLQIQSQTGTHLYVGDLLYTLITKKNRL